MKEIGGYFGLEKFANNQYYKDLIPLNSARNALVYLLKAKKIRKVYIPYFLCDSVEEVCKREGCEYDFYHISPEFLPIFEKKLLSDEYMYVVNYFGQIDKDTICSMAKKYENIIIDNVQAFFQHPVKGVDTIYSCRKFFGVPDGAYLSTDTYLGYEIPRDVSMDRMKHVLGRCDGESASCYYDDFRFNDDLLKKIELKSMSRLTANILGGIDYKTICKKREENFAYLDKQLNKYNKLKLTKPSGPYAYPFYCENGMEIKRKLSEKKIFVATLWPNVLNMENCVEKDYAENILPLPVDQRYDENDMQYIIEEVLKCTKN